MENVQYQITYKTILTLWLSNQMGYIENLQVHVKAISTSENLFLNVNMGFGFSHVFLQQMNALLTELRY